MKIVRSVEANPLLWTLAGIVINTMIRHVENDRWGRDNTEKS